MVHRRRLSWRRCRGSNVRTTWVHALSPPRQASRAGVRMGLYRSAGYRRYMWLKRMTKESISGSSCVTLRHSERCPHPRYPVSPSIYLSYNTHSVSLPSRTYTVGSKNLPCKPTKAQPQRHPVQSPYGTTLPLRAYESPPTKMVRRMSGSVAEGEAEAERGRLHVLLHTRFTLRQNQPELYPRKSAPSYAPESNVPSGGSTHVPVRPCPRFRQRV